MFRDAGFRSLNPPLTVVRKQAESPNVLPSTPVPVPMPNPPDTSASTASVASVASVATAQTQTGTAAAAAAAVSLNDHQLPSAMTCLLPIHLLSYFISCVTESTVTRKSIGKHS